MKNGKYRKAATFCLSGCPLREEKSFSQRVFYIFYNQFDFLYMNIYNIIKSNVLEMVQFASALYDYILIY